MIMFCGKNIALVVVLLCGTCWAATAPTNSNPLGLIEVNGTKYWVGNYDKVDFFEAKRRCQYYGLDLVSINSQQEYDLVTKTVLNGAQGTYWTSGNRINGLKNWTWADAVPMTFAPWAPTEPNEIGPNELCAALAIANKGLQDWNCDTIFNFICESLKRNCSDNNSSSQCSHSQVTLNINGACNSKSKC